MNRSETIAMETNLPMSKTGSTLAFAAFGSVLLWLSAKLQVPFWPVPMTMQTLVVVLLPIMFGPRAGALAVALYLGEGAAGLPVFAETPARGIGLAYMMGPTGGYLAGFLLAASTIAALVPRIKLNFVNGLALAAFGHAIIFACGIAWLSASLGFEKAVAVGFMPFMAATVLKVAMAASVSKLMAKS